MVAIVVIGVPVLTYILIILALLYIPKKKGESVKDWWNQLNSGKWK